MLQPGDFFDFQGCLCEEIFKDIEFVWQAIPRIMEWLEKHLPGERVIKGKVMEGAWIHGDDIFIDEEAVVEPGAFIQGPAWIGKGTKVSQGAYVRGNVIACRNSTIGHATEAKNSVFLDHARAPHFAYVGDSILGVDSNLGAGTKLSNLAVSSVKDKETGERPTLKIRIKGKTYDTGLSKFGAIVGDGVQIGCNSVLNPGTLVGKHCLVYANSSVRGYIPGKTVVKLRQSFEHTERRM